MLHRGCLLAGTLILAVTSMLAAEKTKAGARGAPSSEKALVYFIRPGVGFGAAIDVFVYANDTFVGVLDNNSYFYADLLPGRYSIATQREPRTLTAATGPLSNDFSTYSVEFAAGATYYLDLMLGARQGPRAVGVDEGEQLLSRVKWMSSPTAKQAERGVAWERARKSFREFEWTPDTRAVVSDLNRKVASDPDMTIESILESARTAQLKPDTMSHLYVESWAKSLSGRRALEQGDPEAATRFWREAQAGFAELARLSKDYGLEHWAIRFKGTIPPLWVQEDWPKNLERECSHQQALLQKAIECDREGIDAAALADCVRASVGWTARMETTGEPTVKRDATPHVAETDRLVVVTLRAKEGSVALQSLDGNVGTMTMPFTTKLNRIIVMPTPRSTVRSADRRPSITIASERDPRNIYWLVKLDPVKTNDQTTGRSLKVESPRVWGGIASCAPDEDFRIRCEQIEDGPGLWRLTPVKNLKPGEYGVYVGKNENTGVIFDFGIDEQT